MDLLFRILLDQNEVYMSSLINFNEDSPDVKEGQQNF